MGNGKERTYAAIDVGTTKIATLVAEVTPTGSMEIVGLGHATSEGMRKGMVVNPAELTDSVRRSVEDAQNMLGKRVPPVHVGISGGHLRCINAAAQFDPGGHKGPRTFSQRDIDRLLSSTVDQSDTQRRVVHVVPRTYQVDDQNGVRSPIGMSGEKLVAESHVVVGDAAAMSNLERVVQAANVRVRGMVIEHLASAEAVLTSDERQSGVILVDIGGGTSDIAIYRDGALWYTGTIPVAGHHFTNDIAIGLGLPPSIAETTKLQYGSALIDGIDPHDIVEVGSGLGDHTRPISQLTLNHLLHDRAVELVRMILHKASQAGLVKVPLGGVVLTGGSANLAGLAEIVADYGKCEVRIGSPVASLGLPAELEQSSFATGVGLLRWAIQHRHPGAIAASVSVNQSALGKLKGWFTRFTPHHAIKVGA